MTMTEEQIERAQIEMVFGLGGGELHEPDSRFPDEWDGVFAYWYNELPHYVRESEINPGPMQFQFRTAIVCELYGQARTPEGWTRVAHWTSSGESGECWACEPEDPNEDPLHRDDCPICKGDGFVYLGDGYREVLYATPWDDE